jgi:hypothetical protein
LVEYLVGMDYLSLYFCCHLIFCLAVLQRALTAKVL